MDVGPVDMQNNLALPVFSLKCLISSTSFARRPSSINAGSLGERHHPARRRRIGKMQPDLPDPPTVSRDANNDYLVALARQGGVDPVSGDPDLAEPSLAVEPRQYLKQLLPRGRQLRSLLLKWTVEDDRGPAQSDLPLLDSDEFEHQDSLRRSQPTKHSISISSHSATLPPMARPTGTGSDSY